MDSAENRLSIGLPAALAQWVAEECARRGISKRQLVKLALTSYKSAGLEPEVTGKKRTSRNQRQEKYLAEIRRVYGPHLAAENVGVDPAEVDHWAEHEDFHKRFEAAQMAWLERLEQDLAEVGRGATKGNASALAAVLAARHPDYGRLKIEQVNRLTGPTFADIYDKIREMAGEKLGETIVKACREIVDRRFSNLTD